MTEATQCFRYEDYTVGWIAAIPAELQAAIEMLDQKHHDLPQPPNNSTIYTLGSIGSHNVVLACLSVGQLGIGSAATVATEMRTTFPCLRFGLLVGIGGGVPSTDDIRLGDIVVSQPRAGRDGVVQYDFGKSTTSGFQRTNRLNPPPDILLNALSNYQARNLDPDGDLLSHRFKPKNTYTMLENFPAPDMLFPANYNHVGGTNCKKCDLRQLCRSSERNDRWIMVHYGTIASGNQVIKDGTKRDQLSNRLGEVLCFEMEAAGIMNTFPSLVIRGICDYADSHKNDDWQRFAARAAAAFGKDFLNIVPPAQPSLALELAETTRSSRKSRSSSRHGNSSVNVPNWWSDYTDLVKYEFTIQSISDYDPLRIFRGLARDRCPGTTKWILQHEEYLQWYTAEDSSCLWLTGKIGSGKTLVTSTIIEHLLQESKNSDRLVLHYFYRYSHKIDLSAIAFLKSCIKQMLTFLDATRRSCPSATSAYLRHYHGSNEDSCYFEDLIENAFIPLVNMIDRITIVVDGLDECDNQEIQMILKFLRSFLEEPDRKVLISGRASLDISQSIPGSSSIRMSEEDATSDISEYIKWKLKEKTLERQITNDPTILTEIETTLLDNAEQMILWVKLQIENLWEDCFGDMEIRAALKDLPKDLTETYDRCFKRISSGRGIYGRGYAAKILPWMIEAAKPLTMTQLRQALAIDPQNGIINHGMMPSEQDTIRSCANLILQNADEQIVLAHHSVYDYLEERRRIQKDETTEMPRLSADITLAKLCVIHLISESYTLAVQRLDEGGILHLGSPEILRLTVSIPRLIRPFLPQPKPIQVTLPPTQSKSTKLATLPDFFHYAREQWSELTRGWNALNDCYPNFVKLALNPNLTWRLHPWKPLGQSLDSHYFGLLGWSIVNRHESLFRLLFSQTSESLLREDLYAAPFYPYDGLNCILLAARSNTPWVFDCIPKTPLSALLNSQDSNGWTALHYAVNTGSEDLVDKLVDSFRRLGVPFNSSNTACLEIAATKGYHHIVLGLVEYPEFQNNEVLLKATTAAILNGHASLLDVALNPAKVMRHATRAINDAVLKAANEGHVDVVESVARTIRNDPYLYSTAWDSWKKQIPAAAFYGAIRTGYLDSFDAMDPESLIGTDANFEDALVSLVCRILKTNDPSKYRQWLTLSEKLFITLDSPAKADLLHVAIKNDACEQVELLFECGYNPYRLSLDGSKLLQELLLAGRDEITKIFVKHGAFGKTPPNYLMNIAIRLDDLDLAKSSLAAGVKPTDYCLYHREFDWNTNFIHEVCTIGGDEMFQLLLDVSYDWWYEDEWWWKNGWGDMDKVTLLIRAAKAGRIGKVETLCRALHKLDKSIRKGYLDKRDISGQTAFFHSCTQGEFACAKVLLTYGANPYVANEEGHTILQTMVQSYNLRKDARLVFGDLIKSKGINVNMCSASGTTALHTAVNCLNKTAIKWLLRLGADISLQDSQGRTPVHIATTITSKDSELCVKALLFTSNIEVSSLDVQDDKGNTALHYAVRSKKINSVKDLLAAGASFKIPNAKNETALELSLRRQRGDPIREFFSQSGYDVQPEENRRPYF